MYTTISTPRTTASRVILPTTSSRTTDSPRNMPRFGRFDDRVDFKHCILCGIFIGYGGGKVPEENAFRARELAVHPGITPQYYLREGRVVPSISRANIPRPVYRGPNKVELSGVGSEQLSYRLMAPIDPAARWDTMGENYFVLMDAPCWPWDVFLFHEVCCDELMRHFADGEMSGMDMDTGDTGLESLLEALNDLPQPGRRFPSSLVFSS